MIRRSFLGTTMLGLVGLALPSLPSLPAGAQQRPPGQWDLLGERRVSLRVERDTIAVRSTDATYTALMLDVLGRHPIELVSVVLVHGAGQRREIEVGELVRPRGRTRVIDLPGGMTAIRHVELVYRASGGPRRGRGHVRVFGMR